MADMLTAKDVQDLLQVDRSTVYRMAEAGRLPAIKVGKQWRFPAAQIEEWMTTQMGLPFAALACRAIIFTAPDQQLRIMETKVLPRCCRCNVCSLFKTAMLIFWA